MKKSKKKPEITCKYLKKREFFTILGLFFQFFGPKNLKKGGFAQFEAKNGLKKPRGIQRPMSKNEANRDRDLTVIILDESLDISHPAGGCNGWGVAQWNHFLVNWA